MGKGTPFSLLHALRELVMPEVQFPQPLVEPVQQNQQNPPPQQEPLAVQDPPTAVQIPPQNPLAPQAEDGTRGELEVLTKFDCLRFACSSLRMFASLHVPYLLSANGLDFARSGLVY